MIEGDDQLSDITDAEKRILAKNPGCRLACQVRVRVRVRVTAAASRARLGLGLGLGVGSP